MNDSNNQIINSIFISTSTKDKVEACKQYIESIYTLIRKILILNIAGENCNFRMVSIIIKNAEFEIKHDWDPRNKLKNKIKTIWFIP